MIVLSYLVLPRLENELRLRLPEVEIQYVELNAVNNVSALADSDVSVAICIPPIAREGIAVERIGSFELRVPLLPSKDDRGTLALLMDAPLEQCLRPGATIRGLASSTTTDRVSPIACAVGPDGRVRIAVTTHDRTLEFTSRYTVLSSSQPSSTSRIVRSTASMTPS